MASRGLLDVEVRYLDEHGDAVAGRLDGVDAEAVVAGPARATVPDAQKPEQLSGLVVVGRWGARLTRSVSQKFRSEMHPQP